MEIKGFSKLSQEEKIEYVAKCLLASTNNSNRSIFADQKEIVSFVKSFFHSDQFIKSTFNSFSENTISSYHLPYGICPNFLLNGKVYTVPMVIEESSVVAAASKAAKFWFNRGGFNSEVISTTKVGQIHFLYHGSFEKLEVLIENSKKLLLDEIYYLEKGMRSRGGGVKDLKLQRGVLENQNQNQNQNHYELRVFFETANAMGANFINSILEQLAASLAHAIPGISIIMAILSNYTPDCLVRSFVECRVADLWHEDLRELNMNARDFALKFKLAVDIAREDSYRAVTHNKGIFNGVDALVVASGNDYRAVEAAGHAYAARDGKYRSLSFVDIDVVKDTFRFTLELPLAIGTTGGLTSLHPLAKLSLMILNNPSAKTLMNLTCALGLAQNFQAVHALITTGIQKGHMKMHLSNMLMALKVTDEEKRSIEEFAEQKSLNFAEIKSYVEGLRYV
ncbi:MAG: hydroxymethylglutaryl-CoA reductase, degradative [Oligoflexia bacterium]|nr:hydroxymethylglutaryl-CoA reductase, degradative [Oligoflexia bacterium]